VVDVSTPHHGFESSLEIISSQYNVGDLLSSRASTSHSKSNISSVKSLYISNSTTSDCNSFDITIIIFLECFDYSCSVSWSCLGKYSKVTEDPSDCTLVVAHSSLLIEIKSIHDNISTGQAVNILLGDKTDLQCNSLSSSLAISGEHSNRDSWIISWSHSVFKSTLCLWTDFVF